MHLLPRTWNRAARTRRVRSLLCLEELESRLAPSATVTVNATANVHAIDPLIYGSAFATTAQIADLNLTINRDGGNASDTYDWQVDDTNHGSDWYYESIPSGSGNGQGMDSFVSQAKAGGAQPDLTVPILPYVATLGNNRSDLGSYPVTVYGAQQSADPYNSNFGNGETTKGVNITDTNPLYNYVANSPAFEQTWIQHLMSTFGTPASGGVQYFTLGNEPALWNSTHRDIHPNGETNTELLNDIISYGSMIKSVDPGAQILGPEEWGWTGYLIDGADAAAGNWNATYTGIHGEKLNVQQWLLQQLQQYQTTYGTRLLDYFTLHYYPQESVSGDSNGGVDSNNVDQATALLRNQVTRALWDPTYTDPSWINSKVDLIPMMQSWVNTYYPGTQTGITEYNFGAEGNMNGATTQADVYGIFGQQGLDLATRWTTPATGSPTYLAMKLWRNYDGSDSGFGNTSVSASVADPDQTDAFAAIRSSDGALTVAVINKNLYSSSNPSATTSVTVNLSGFANSGVAQDWQLAAINGSDQTTAAITHLSDIDFSGNSFTVNVPMESVTMFVVEPANPVSQFLVTPQGGATEVAGHGFLVAVQAADRFGNPITNYTGPTTVTVSVSPTSTGSSFPNTVSIGSSGLGLFLATLQQAGTYTISAASGSLTGISSPVTITAGPAAKLAFAVQPATTPTGVTLPTVSVQVLDQFGNLVKTDNSDVITIGIANGPGPFASGSVTTATVHNGAASFSNLVLTVPGTYTLSAVVPHLYTGPFSTSFLVAPLQVVAGSFTSSPSGFSLQFNAPFLINSTTPALFGSGFGATAPVPSVKLLGPSGPVEGSLVLTAATNSITFVETDTASMVNNNTPILPDGTYTVDVHSSGATGFQALDGGGGFLDGRGTGVPGSGDFTTTFTINSGAMREDVLWVPATADGPGQALNAPGKNLLGGGYPVYLDDSYGTVTSVTATLTYNAELLTVSPSSSGGFTVKVPTAGTADLTYSGPPLPEGKSTLVGFITATVPGGSAANPTPYRAEDLLHLTAVSLNAGAIPVTTGDAIHLVAYVGDADGNGGYSNNDAVLITQVALQTDTGFAAYPLVDPVIVADTDGAGFIPADASLQVNEAGVGFPTANLPNPPIPSGVVFQTTANIADPTFSPPGGETFTVSLAPANSFDPSIDGLVRRCTRSRH